MNLEDLVYPLRDLYNRLPDRPRSAVGSSYRRLPERVRLGARFPEFRQLASEVEGWSTDQVAEYQLRQLRLCLTHAAQYSSFYAKRFAEAGFDPRHMSSPADITACPQLTKTDLAQHLDEIVCTQPPRKARLYITTGGSTGTPVGFYLQKGVSRPKEQAFLEAQWRRAGYSEGARVAVIRGQVISPSGQGRIAHYDGTRGWLMLSSYHMTEDRLSDYLDAISAFQPEVLHAYPSAALQLVELLQRTGQRWPTKLRCMLAGSERVTQPQKRVLEEAFACRVYTWYGHSERAVLAGEGRVSGSLYFWPTYGYVEFGPPDDNGLCEIIGTSFHNMAMPLVRYRTGDFARLHDASVHGPKELDWPAVRTVDGREQEYLVTATGRKISLTAFNMHDRSFDGLYAVQFFQDKPGYAELRYIAGSHFDYGRLPQIESLVARKLGDDMRFALKEVNSIEKTGRGKGKWLVSNLSSPSSR